MHLDVIRGIKPTRRRWLPIGRARDGYGHLKGFTLCWWTGMLIVLVHGGKRAILLPMPARPLAPQCRCMVRPVMGTDRVVNRDEEG